MKLYSRLDIDRRSPNHIHIRNFHARYTATEYRLAVGKKRGMPRKMRYLRPMNDTDQRSMQILIEGYRTMSPDRKLRQVVELTQAAQKMALARIRTQYGPLDDREETIRLAALWLPRETLIKYLGWDPAEKGL